MSKLCLCLTASTLKGCEEQLRRYGDCIQMAEMRLDLLHPSERTDVADLPSRCRIPLILTIRLPEDGGRWGEAGETPEDRERLLVSLLEKGGWTWVDIEHGMPMNDVVRAARITGTRIVRSMHDFTDATANRPVSELAALMRGMAVDGAVPKLAVSCNGSRQLLTLARLALAVEDIPEKVILGMGEFGAPTRILAQRMKSLWTYASSLGGEDDPPAAAPGQYDPRILKHLYRFETITAETPLFAVTGNPIAHSRSPRIHNAWLQQAGMDGCYLPIRSDDAAAMLETCDIWGIRGISVTVPHKERALSLCDYAGVLAGRIGAANTLLRAGDGWRARNTDAGGFMAPLPEVLGLGSTEELKGMKALIIGAGGASRAAVHVLAEAGVELIILNRTPGKAESLALEVGAGWGALDEGSAELLSGGVDFAVQTTSLGMPPQADIDPVPWWDFKSCRLVYDMVYEPPETVLLARARKAGVKTLNGSCMLENQARLQFEMFTGKKVPAV